MSITSLNTGYDYSYTLPFGSSAYMQVVLPPTSKTPISITLPEGTSLLSITSTNSNIKIITDSIEENTSLIYALDTDADNIIPATLELFLYTLPDALGGQVKFSALEAPTTLHLEEKFSLNTYDAVWLDESFDPDGLGSSSFSDTDLNVLWSDVPYAFKQKFPANNSFGGTDSFGEDGYLKNVSVYLGGMGLLDQDMATPFTEEESRYGEYVPEIVYFGIHLLSRITGRSVCLALAHTNLPLDFVSGDIIIGNTTKTQIVIIPDEATLVNLSDYNTFLGGGIVNAYIAGPSGLDADNNFDPVVFKNTSSSATWIDCTDNTFWAASNGYWNSSGEYWNDSPADLILKVPFGATWNVGFRPTKVKITCDVGSPPLIVSLGPSSSGSGYGYDANYVSGTELDLVCTDDIERINLYASGYTSGTKIYKIEFLV